MSPRRPTSHTRSERGFSLVEMLVVLAIVALAAAVAFPSLRRGREPAPATVLAEVRALVLRARTNAIARGETQTLEVDLDGRAVVYPTTGARVELPKALSVTLLTGRELLAADDVAALLFFADGGSSGAELSLVDDRNHRLTLVVPWLTGVPTLRHPDE